MGIALTEDQIERILQDAERALGAYETAAGTTACGLAAHVVTARKS